MCLMFNKLGFFFLLQIKKTFLTIFSFRQTTIAVFKVNNFISIFFPIFFLFQNLEVLFFFLSFYCSKKTANSWFYLQLIVCGFFFSIKFFLQIILYWFLFLVSFFLLEDACLHGLRFRLFAMIWIYCVLIVGRLVGWSNLKIIL